MAAGYVTVGVHVELRSHFKWFLNSWHTENMTKIIMLKYFLCF